MISPSVRDLCVAQNNAATVSEGANPARSVVVSTKVRHSRII